MRFATFLLAVSCLAAVSGADPKKDAEAKPAVKPLKADTSVPPISQPSKENPAPAKVETKTPRPSVKPGSRQQGRRPAQAANGKAASAQAANGKAASAQAQVKVARLTPRPVQKTQPQPRPLHVPFPGKPAVDEGWNKIQECAKELGLSDVLKSHTRESGSTFGVRLQPGERPCNFGFTWNNATKKCELHSTPTDVGGWHGQTPEADNDDVCETRAVFATDNKCWNRYQGLVEDEYCDVEDGGHSKSADITRTFFTKGYCTCDGSSHGDSGFECYGECTKSEEQKQKCNQDRVCRKYANSTTYCGCAMGFRLDSRSGRDACLPLPDACEACQFDCHVSSSCLPLGQKFTCSECNAKLGFQEHTKTGSTTLGRSCENINECAKENNCDKHATCEDENVLDNEFGFKYTCRCNKGWRAVNGTGTKCRPCIDENECLIENICGEGGKCTNTEGSYTCACEDGYTKGPDGKCVDIDECKATHSPCNQYATCKNLPGTFKCTCNEGFIDLPKDGIVKPQVNCELDREYHCKKCDELTTNCLIQSIHVKCQCKDNHTQVNERQCKPIVWCNEPVECAPSPKGKCIELSPPGSGYKCECGEGFKGDGVKCQAENICIREAPCNTVRNADCLSRDGKDKYECVCKEGFVRQLADRDDLTKPCFAIGSNTVDNCTLCDKTTQECKPVIDLAGKEDPHLKSCYCRKGYEKPKDGRQACININECRRESLHNCDRIRAICIDREPHLDDGKEFECKCLRGYEGNGTRNNCHDIDECKEKPNPCEGPHLKCKNTPGSYLCECEEGYNLIAGTNACNDIDECLRNPCPSNAKCINTPGSYECNCETGYKANETLHPKGKGECKDIDECTDFPKTYKKDACDMESSTCRNTPGSWECDCKRPHYKKCGDDCIDVDECLEQSDSCDPKTTTCKNRKNGYDCVCKKGFEVTENEFACKNINECANATLNKCNDNSECVDTVGTYYCKCNSGFKESSNHFDPQHPICKRESVCTPEKCVCGSCMDIETPPFYRCLCPYGSFTPNDTMCLTPKYCDGGEYTCPNGECVKNECVCKQNYEWVNYPGPYTPDRVKERKGCKLVNLCEHQGCPLSGMSCTPQVTHPFKTCKCQDGYEHKNGLCIDINECTHKQEGVNCPSPSECVNYNGSYACECPDGYFNENVDPKTRRQAPLCKNIDECTKGTHNCSRVPNSLCKDTTPGFVCECKRGYFKTTAREQRKCDSDMACLEETCQDIDECETATCPEHGKCINTDGSYYCKCDEGYKLENGVCLRVDVCQGEGSGHNCTRWEKCVLTETSFKCDCIEDYERNVKFANCTYVPVCGTPKDTCKLVKMKCVDDATNGRHTCVCREHQKYINNKCIDVEPCSFSPCPKGPQNLCVDDKKTKEGFRCECATDYKKDVACAAAHPNNCSCVPENLCEKYPCPKNAFCDWKDGKRTCTCNDGYQMRSDKEECEDINVCTKEGKPYCSPTTEDCKITGPGKAICECNKESIRHKDKCVANPCNSHVCPEDARKAQAVDASGEPICICECGSGFKFEDGKCKAVDVCGCLPAIAPCQKAAKCASPDMFCYDRDGEPTCECPLGYYFDEKTKNCEDYDECANGTLCALNTKCKNTIGSFDCICEKRGQTYHKPSKECIPDIGCTLEGRCREAHKECTMVGGDSMYCVCLEPYGGNGKPGEPCEPINYCARPEHKDKCKGVEGAVQVVDPIAKTCKCSCEKGCTPVFDKNGVVLQKCNDIDECADPKICANQPYTKCKNRLNLCHGYDCVCIEGYAKNNVTGGCERLDMCVEKKVKCGDIGKCDPLNGLCTCPEGFKWNAVAKDCVDINECVESNPCRGTEKCINTVGSYECECHEGYYRDETTNDMCVDIDECLEPKACPEDVECVNKAGGYECKCDEKKGQYQNGPYDCVKHNTDCDKCPENAHCLKSVYNQTVFNCTCNNGYRMNDKGACDYIDLCKELKPCHVNASCETGLGTYVCKCDFPLVGTGIECKVPDLCDPIESEHNHNDCPAESICISKYPPFITVTGRTVYVDCECTRPGYRFNPNTRQCEDIDECAETKPCPTEAKCENTIGSYRCVCPDGFKWNIDTNLCENINECQCTVDGCYDKDKCRMGEGRCQDTNGSWVCVCADHYEHPNKNKGDEQQCLRIEYCGTELDDCDKKTTTCKEVSNGFECRCKEGHQYLPNTRDKACEDINECHDGTHNCTIYEQCVNLAGGFHCNCTNDIAHVDEVTKKCVPHNNCSEPLDCGPYGFPKQLSNGTCVCLCMNRFEWNAKEKACIPINICDQNHLHFECPMNSECFFTQRQNETEADGSPGVNGTYGTCVCKAGFEMIDFQCHQKDICKEQPGICGKEGTCVSRKGATHSSLEYTCDCPPGVKPIKTMHGVRCEEADCSKRSPCDPDTAVCSVHSSLMRCDCRRGFEGIGTLQSPCTPIKVCEERNPCSKMATCAENGDGTAKCTCNAGYRGNGTWCADENECETANDCHANASCTNTQGSYICTCNANFTGDGKNCEAVKICLLKRDKCHRESTDCRDQETGGYTCDCKVGFEPTPGSTTVCTNINECKNGTACGIEAISKKPHGCLDTIGSYECLCLPGYQHADKGLKKTACEDVNECEKKPCLIHSECENLVGSYVCNCDKGYNKTITGESPLDYQCDIVDLCKKDPCGPNSECRMIPEQPKHECVCLPGYEKTTADGPCEDIDECTMDGKVKNHTQKKEAHVDCVNTPGSYNFVCREGYVERPDTQPWLVCDGLNECAEDPAYAEAIKIIDEYTAKANNGSYILLDNVTALLPPPQINGSAYAQCFNIKIFPLCVDLDYESNENMELFRYERPPELKHMKGYGCRCVDGRTPIDYLQYLGCRSAVCRCLGKNIDPECVNGVPGNCKCKDVPGKTMYMRKDAEGNRFCSETMCDSSTNMTSVRNGLLVEVSCEEGVLKVPAGWEIVYDEKNEGQYIVKDINECVTMENPCCGSKDCVGENCVKCFNTLGSYECKMETPSGNLQCKAGALDWPTCECAAAVCDTSQAWFYDCRGCNITQRTFANDNRKVCSRILNEDSSGFKTFPSLKALLEETCTWYRLGKDGVCTMNTAANPDKAEDHPTFNYYGECKDAWEDVPTCEGSGEAFRTQTIGHSPKAFNICLYGSTYVHEWPAGTPSGTFGVYTTNCRNKYYGDHVFRPNLYPTATYMEQLKAVVMEPSK